MSTPLAVPTDPSTTPNTEVTFPVTGMTCASCVRRIEKALNKVNGVQDASVNLATEKAKVVFDPAQVSIHQMRAAVKKAGYTVGELTHTGPVAAQQNDTAETATVRAAVLYASRDSAEPFVVEIDGTVFTRSRDPHEQRRSGHKRPVCPVPRKCAGTRQCKEPCQPNSVFCPRHLAEARERVAQVKGGDRPKRWVAPVRTAGPEWS